MKRSLVPLAAAGFLALAAVPARAEFALGDGSALIFEISGTYTDNVTENAAAVTVNDGVFAFDKTNTAASPGDSVDLTVYFANLSTDYRVLIYTGGLTGAYLSNIVFNDPNNVTTATLNTTLSSANGALAANYANGFSFDPSGAGTYGLSFSGTFTSYDSITLTFNFDNTNDQLAIDAIANPEPGTMALFGLGALGLGGLAWRRRRAAVRGARKD